MQFWGSLRKCENCKFSDIFWNFLDKKKSNFGQEYVKKLLLFFQGKNETIAPDFPGKMTVFGFGPTFPPVPI